MANLRPIFVTILVFLAMPTLMAIAQPQKEVLPIEKIDLGDLKDYFQVVKVWRQPKQPTMDGGFVGPMLTVKLKCIKDIELGGRRVRAGYFDSSNELILPMQLELPDFRIEAGELIATDFGEPFDGEWKRCVLREIKSTK